MMRPPGVRLRHQDRTAGVLQRADAVQHEVIDRDARLRSTGQREAADRKSDRREYLNALAAVGGVGHDERAVGRDRERGRIDDAAGLCADLDDLPGAGLRFVDAEDGVRAPIEDEDTGRTRIAESPSARETVPRRGPESRPWTGRSSSVSAASGDRSSKMTMGTSLDRIASRTKVLRYNRFGRSRLAGRRPAACSAGL